MTALEPIPYEPAWRGRVLDLQREVWGTAASPAEFDWWFEENPAGPRVFALVPDGDAVAGASAMSFFRLRLDGREAPVVFALDAATHPRYRGRGLWSRLELANEEAAARAGAVAALGFTNPVAGPILVGKLGWRDLAWLRFWAHPLRPGGREPGFREPSVRGVEPLAAFGAETDDLYAEASRGWPAHVVRDAAHLDWRYARSPRPYRLLAARRRGRLEGYAVVTHRAVSGRPVGAVADLVATSGWASRALLRACARSLVGVRALVAYVSQADRPAHLATGFLPTPKRTRFIGKPLAPGIGLPGGRAAWHLALGDTDLF